MKSKSTLTNTYLLYLIPLLLFLNPILLNAQNDTIMSVDFGEIQVQAFREAGKIKPIPEYTNLMVLGGRKLEEIPLENMPANIGEKVGRQIFSRIPGAFVYDMDGSGNQVNISLRGLDAHRSWELSVRQNGIITNTDMYGYPASHYSAPMEAVERIELIRGTGALQYGQQFGGMLNYILKKPDTSRVVSFESITTVGSFGLLSTYNSIGGKIGNLIYHAYYHRRVSDGYRDNANSDAEAQHLSLKYDFPKTDLSITAELSRSTYLYQIPGPLNDEMFNENPRMATRFRNYYSPDIIIPALIFDWSPAKNTQFSLSASGVFGDRSSVVFPGNSIREDIINPQTNDFSPRDVAVHDYYSRTLELRMLHQYQIGGIKNDLSTSVRYFNNKNLRKQRGIGTTGFDYDLTVPGGFGRDLELLSNSLAFAVENQLWINQQLSISPGIRMETGSSDLSGRIDYIEEQEVPLEISYDFITIGMHGQYFLPTGGRIFAGISQANRPVLFQDLVPGDPFSRISRDIEHSFGYNAEIGIENYANDLFQYNITFFRTYIGDRIGNLVETIDGNTFLVKSNIGNSMTDGVELFVNFNLLDNDYLRLSLYNASSYMKGRYTSGVIRSGEENISLKGNSVESVPEWLIRTGVLLEMPRFTASLNHQYVGETFADPLNTKMPDASGAVGLVPSYQVWDFSTSLRFTSQFELRFNFNNIFDKKYFTKRPTMYPGPGIWPSDGRSVSFSGIIRL